MLLSAVSVLVVAQSSSEIPEGLMNNPVYSERVSVALVIQHEKLSVRLYDIISHYVTNGTIFGKKVVEHKICVLIFTTNLCETFLILRRIRQGIAANVHVFI